MVPRVVDGVAVRKLLSTQIKLMPSFSLAALHLDQLPLDEDNVFEFKSSSTPLNELKKKINRAATGFANSGGGYFVAGVDDHGNPDGGMSPQVGRQSLIDWVDQAIQNISPSISYEQRIFDETNSRGHIDNGKVVLVIAIEASDIAPHGF